MELHIEEEVFWQNMSFVLDLEGAMVDASTQEVWSQARSQQGLKPKSW